MSLGRSSLITSPRIEKSIRGFFGWLKLMVQGDVSRRWSVWDWRRRRWSQSWRRCLKKTSNAKLHNAKKDSVCLVFCQPLCKSITTCPVHLPQAVWLWRSWTHEEEVAKSSELEHHEYSKPGGGGGQSFRFYGSSLEEDVQSSNGFEILMVFHLNGKDDMVLWYEVDSYNVSETLVQVEHQRSVKDVGTSGLQG